MVDSTRRPDEIQSDVDAEHLGDAEHFMQIGEVAHRTGLTQRALRYYESVGLLAPASRMDGGFRLYSEQDVSRLEKIVELK
ncbi:MAG TPA: MerR family transcriptional regulator, partial [Chloroflexota bacterium]|nr:MerR family transcriptional regulator [Chloroflexota bacterium]